MVLYQVGGMTVGPTCGVGVDTLTQLKKWKDACANPRRMESDVGAPDPPITT
jgi:hypothetical protein